MDVQIYPSMENPYLQLKHLSETRKSCRKFKPDEIPQDITDKILSVAANSPYAGGSRSWGVTTVKETAVKERLVLAIAPQTPLASAAASNVDATFSPAEWARQLVRDPVYQLK